MVEMKPKNVVTLKVEGSCPTHSRTDILARDTEIVIDEPVERGGTNLGPSPTETLLSSLAACTNVIGHKCAAKHGVTFQAFHVTVTSSFDRRGVTLQEEVDVPFENVEVLIEATTDADDATLEKVKTDLTKFCAVSKVFRNCGSTVTDVWKITRP
ncbi:MAG: OsmC family protein [Rhodospirillaceae bacterium]